MKTLRIGAVVLGLVAAALTGSAWAAPINYTFDLSFTSGPLSGQHSLGVISVDGNDCPCIGNFDPTNPSKTLLGLNITVGGVAFAMNNDTGFGFGPYPDVTFDALGHLTQIDYQGQTTFAGNSYVLDMVGANVGVDFAAFYQGTVGLPAGRVSLALVAVPEPGTLPLLAAALIGAGLAWRRSASKSGARGPGTA